MEDQKTFSGVTVSNTGKDFSKKKTQMKQLG